MKKILFIYVKDYLKYWNHFLHSDWIHDCSDDYIIDFWGVGWNNDLSEKGLLHRVDQFKPDYIYMTISSLYLGNYWSGTKSKCWVPNLSKIKVPKIFVECDTQDSDRNNAFYKQFDKIYCRQPWWDGYCREYSKKIGSIDVFNGRCKNIDSWMDTPLFRWSISEKNFKTEIDYSKKNGVYFIGHTTSPLYERRNRMKDFFNGKISFLPSSGDHKDSLRGENYWNALGNSSALVCPAESNYGGLVPAKIFEYSVSGSAILTNCDLVRFGMSDLDKVVIKYKDWDDLMDKLNMDFSKYYGKARDVIKKHTHKIRYRELFL